MEGYFNNKGIFRLISKWKYHILIIVVVAIIAAAVFSSASFIKPKYKSFATLYPVNISTLSDESETEQMLQILKSQDIKERIFKELELPKHYGLDSAQPHFKTFLNGYFDDNVSFSRTEFESVEITALDVDPQFASDIVDSIITYYNDKVTDMHRVKYLEVIEITSRDIKKKEKEISRLNKQLEEIRREYGILDYKLQTREATRGHSSAEMKKLLNNLKEKGGEYAILDSLLWNAHGNYVELKSDLEFAQSDYEKEITFCHIVSSPYPADKKSFPVRWVIVVLGAIGAFFMSIIVISIMESAKKEH